MATILMIENDRFFRELVSLHLLLAGFTIQVAKDPAEGLRSVIECASDIVLPDLDLPYLSGFEVLDALRSDPAARKIPVIILSARRDEESYARCHKIGIPGIFSKPRKRDERITAIAEALALRAGD